MKLIGYLLIREVDSIRYPIYLDNSYFYIFNNKKYTINNLNLPENTVIILTKSLDYNFEFIYINNKKIKNENYIQIPPSIFLQNN